MPKRSTKSVQPVKEPEKRSVVYHVVYDALINPLSDHPFTGQVTREELEAASLDVDDLVGRGILEELGYVPA